MLILSEVKHLFKHTAIYGFSNVLGKAIGFLMIPVYTRYLSPANYGVLELLELGMSVISIVVGIGLANAVARFLFLYDNEIKKKEVISSSLISLSVISLIVIWIGWTYSGFFSSLLFSDSQYAFFVKLSFIGFAFNSLLEVPLVYLRAQERSLFVVIFSLIRLISQLFLNILFLVYMKLGVVGILYSTAITSVAFTIYLLFWAIRQTGLRFNREIQWDMIKFGSPLIFYQASFFVIHFGDRFILRHVADLSEVGIYSLGYKFGMLSIAFLIHQPFWMIWGVRQYKLIEEPNGEKTYGDTFLVFAIVLLCSWLAISLFSQEIVTFVAEKRYLACYRIIPIVALGYVFRAYADFFAGILLIEKKTVYLSLLALLGAFYCLVNYLILIPRWHGMGAAIATLSTFSFMALINLVISNRIRKIEYHLKKIGVITIYAGILIYIGRFLVIPGSLSTIFMKLGLLFLFFASMFIFLINKSAPHVLLKVKDAYFSKFALIKK